MYATTWGHMSVKLHRQTDTVQGTVYARSCPV